MTYRNDTRKPITKTFILKKDDFFKIYDEFTKLLQNNSKYILNVKNLEPINNEDEYILMIDFKDLLSSEVFLDNLLKLTTVDSYTKQRKSVPVKKFFLVPSYSSFEKDLNDLEYEFVEKISFYEEKLSNYTNFKVLAIDFEDYESSKKFTDRYEELLRRYTECSNSVKLIKYLYWGKPVIEETTL